MSQLGMKKIDNHKGYRNTILNICLYVLHCYYTLRNSNKKMIPMKLYKNKKNPNRGNSL